MNIRTKFAIFDFYSNYWYEMRKLYWSITMIEVQLFFNLLHLHNTTN